VLILINVLFTKFSRKSTINKHTNINGNVVYRIRISKNNVGKLVSLVKPFFINEMLYKLGF